MSDTDRGDEVYQPQEPEASDPTEQLGAEDTLMDPSGTGDPLDEGYAPPDRPWVVEGLGTTAAEQNHGDSLETRLTREVPEPDGTLGDGVGDLVDGDGEPWDDEVGVARAGRLTQQAEWTVPATLTASDVGIDGAAASAEEAAMHVIPEAGDDDALLEPWPPPPGAAGAGTAAVGTVTPPSS